MEEKNKQMKEQKTENKIHKYEEKEKALRASLDEYIRKISPKVNQRLVNINKQRIKQGLPLYNLSTPLYVPTEQKHINQIKHAISATIAKQRKLRNKLQKTKNRKEMRAAKQVQKKEKKKLYQKKKLEKQERRTEKTRARFEKKYGPALVPSNEQLLDTSSSDILTQTAEPFTETENEPVSQSAPVTESELRTDETTAPQTSAATFVPLNERFAAAKEDSKKVNDYTIAKKTYGELAEKIPANGMFEFKIKNDSYRLFKNEYGDFKIKIFNTAAGKYINLNKADALLVIKSDPADFRNACRDVLGSPEKTKDNNLETS